MKSVLFLLDILFFLHFIIRIQFAKSLVEIPLKTKVPLLEQDFIAINLPTVYQCMELCVAYKLCRSLHYTSSGKCVLNSDDYDRQHYWEVYQPHRTFRKIHIPQDVGGACSGHNCAIDEMCVQVGLAYHCVRHEYSTVMCPDGYGHKGDLCFNVFTGKKTWTEAKDYCAITGSELLVVESEKEYGYQRYWMNFILDKKTRSKEQSGKIWTALAYSPVLPSWISTTATVTAGSDLCMGWIYNRTRVPAYQSVLRKLSAAMKRMAMLVSKGMLITGRNSRTPDVTAL